MNLRDEALLMLEKRGSVLEVARAVSRVLHESKIKGAVIGGVAVVLHGYVRTTRDVDVWVGQSTKDIGPLLEDCGATFDRARREFVLDGVPVHLVPNEMAVPAPSRVTEIEGVTTVGLVDLINLKLHSGMKTLARAQDIADVVGLIRERKLTGAFTAKLHKSVRVEFRKLLKAVRLG